MLKILIQTVFPKSVYEGFCAECELVLCRLPATVGEERQWRSALSGFKEAYSDVGFPLKEFNKVGDAFLAAMEKNAGGVTAEQKKEWEELLNKAYDNMKSWGWF